MKIGITVKGDFKHTEKFFDRVKGKQLTRKLNQYGLLGVAALAANTPIDSGKTAESWDYEIRNSAEGVEIIWTNTNTNKGYNIAILVQYGHGTGTGGYVQGRDYINPAIQPVFDAIANDVWEEVTRS